MFWAISSFLVGIGVIIFLLWVIAFMVFFAGLFIEYGIGKEGFFTRLKNKLSE